MMTILIKQNATGKSGFYECCQYNTCVSVLYDSELYAGHPDMHRSMTVQKGTHMSSIMACFTLNINEINDHTTRLHGSLAVEMRRDVRTHYS